MNLPHHHTEKKVIDLMPSDEMAATAADLFSQMGDGTRLRILWLLCHSEECVLDIAAAVGMSAPAVSHHLRMLRQTGLIVNRREGKEVLYTLADTEEAKLLHQMIDDVFRMTCPNRKGCGAEDGTAGKEQ